MSRQHALHEDRGSTRCRALPAFHRPASASRLTRTTFKLRWCRLVSSLAAKAGAGPLGLSACRSNKSPRAPASSGRLRNTRISPLTLRSPQHNAKLADRPKSSESGAHLDEEQHAQSLEPDRLNCEEINGEQALSIRPVPGPPFQRGDAALAPLSRSRGPVRSATGL